MSELLEGGGILSEPVYEFVRGIGWTVLGFRTEQASDREGVLWRIEYRFPEVGECYMGARKGTHADRLSKWHTYNAMYQLTAGERDHILRRKYSDDYEVVTLVRISP